MNQFIENISYLARAYELCSTVPCAKYRLSQTELDILAFLANNPENNTAGDITTYRYISKASVSLTVDSLIGRGLLVRSTDQNDRRRIHLQLTRKANQIVPAIMASRDELREKIFIGFTAAERKKFTALFTRMADNAHAFITAEDCHHGAE